MVNCESCGMPMDDGRYCGYCAPDGKLKSREEIIDNWVDFTMREEDMSREEAEQKVLFQMSQMPTWKR